MSARIPHGRMKVSTARRKWEAVRQAAQDGDPAKMLDAAQAFQSIAETMFAAWKIGNGMSGSVKREIEAWANGVREGLTAPDLIPRAALDKMLAEATEVKPLVWEDNGFDQSWAQTPFGEVSVQDYSNRDGWTVDVVGDDIGEYPTREEAKAVAQAEFARRVRACLKGGDDE